MNAVDQMTADNPQAPTPFFRECPEPFDRSANLMRIDGKDSPRIVLPLYDSIKGSACGLRDVEKDKRLMAVVATL